MRSEFTLKFFNILKKPVVLIPIILGLGLYIVDSAFSKLMLHYTLPMKIIDIQTPSSLYCKLDYVRNFKGKKIVIIGDSVVYGRTMLEEGDEEWRQHTLSAYLEQQFNQEAKADSVLVMNIGMNGALPADLEYLIKLIVPLQVDILICDLTLRSFSKDFSNPSDIISRAWIPYLSTNPEGKYEYKRTQGPFYQKIEDLLHSWFVNFSALYRYRDYIQWLVFNGEPAQAVITLRNDLNRMLKGTPPPRKRKSFAFSLKS